MRRILFVLCLICLLIPAPVKADWEDPFTCDPYIFPFDFKGGYDSIVTPMLIRSATTEDQVLTLSMWPEYSDAEHVAPSEWFTIEPQTAALPGGGIAAFNIRCEPTDYEELTYITYLKVSRTVAGENYWERALTVRVRFGSAIPVLEYSAMGWRLATIRGNEGTGYTQDQMSIKVTNKSFTPNYFVLYPVMPSPPGTDNIQTSDEGYRKLIDQWRDPLAVTVYPEPSGAVSASGKYDRYTLYYDKGNKKVEFGEFLAASYDRGKDTLEMSLYPYQLSPRETREIPFVLRVNKSVPSGIYRFQVHVGPSGESYVGVSMSKQYETKFALTIEREPGVSLSTFFWMMVVFGVIVAGGLAYLLAKGVKRLFVSRTVKLVRA